MLRPSHSSPPETAIRVSRPWTCTPQLQCSAFSTFSTPTPRVRDRERSAPREPIQGPRPAALAAASGCFTPMQQRSRHGAEGYEPLPSAAPGQPQAAQGAQAVVHIPSEKEASTAAALLRQATCGMRQLLCDLQANPEGERWAQ